AIPAGSELHDFLLGMAQPMDLVVEYVTTLPDRTLSRIERTSDSVARGRLLPKSTTRLSMRPRYTSLPSGKRIAACGVTVALVCRTSTCSGSSSRGKP